MRYYDFEDSDNESKQEIEQFFDESPSEAERFMHMTHMGLENRQSNQGVLNASIRICEKSFFWKFYSEDKKVGKLYDVFMAMQSLLESDD